MALYYYFGRSISIRDNYFNRLEGNASKIKRVNSLEPLLDRGLSEDELRFASNFDWLFVYPHKSSPFVLSNDPEQIDVITTDSKNYDLERYYLRKDNSLYVLIYSDIPELFEIPLNVIKHSKRSLPLAL